jgi:hypothetical protein
MMPAVTAALAALACSIAVAASLRHSGQLITRVVNIDWVHNTLYAVRITQVAVAGQKVPFGEFALHLENRDGTPFEADEDWLKNMTVTFTNRTDKVIVCAGIMLWFPETKGANHEFPNATTMYLIRVGQRPESALYRRDGSKMQPDTNKPLVFAPGQTLVIPIGNHIDEIQSQVESVGYTPLSHITKVNIQRGSFYFTDGTQWQGVGTYWAPDPEHPGNYTKLAENYFPGNLSRALEIDHQ